MVDKTILHKVLGSGVVTEISEDKGVMTVLFDEISHIFPYPHAFEKHLTADDAETQAFIEAEIIKISTQKKEVIAYREVTPEHTTHNYPRDNKNIIFKYNFCDGGASDKKIGFNGVCSEENIRYNIEKAKRFWCSNDNCPCAKYLKGKYSYEKLCKFMSKTGGVCNESYLLRDFTAYSQKNLHSTVQKNSLCVLTTRKPYAKEDERIVFAVFLVDKYFEGSGDHVGWTAAHKKFKIMLNSEDADKIPLWRYYAREKDDQIRWDRGLTKPFDSANAAALLADIADIKTGTKEEALAKEFFEHFCDLNGFDAKNPPKASGTLCVKG